MASEDDLVEVSPCPNCRSPLTVSVADLGHLVECPSCNTQFRARRPGADVPPPLDRPRSFDRDSDYPNELRRSRPGARDDDEDDRPRSTPRSRRRPDDDEYEDDRDDLGERDRDRDRGRGRRRIRDDYDDRPQRSRPGQGATTALAVINLVMTGLVVLCGCANIGMSMFIRNMVKQNGGPPAGLNLRPGQLESELAIMTIAGTIYILSSGLFLAAGLTIMNRARSARGFAIACVVFAAIAILFQVISGVIAAKNGDLDDAEPSQICGAIIGILIWIAYIVTSLILLSKSGRQLS